MSSVRTKPLIGDKPWFGPRRFGWGWTAVSWQGWVVVGVTVLLTVPTRAFLPDGTRVSLTLVTVAVALAIALVKGSSPGGDEDADKFDRLRGARPRLVSGWRPPDEPSVNEIVGKWPRDRNELQSRRD